MEIHHAPLFNGRYVNRWLVTRILEEPVSFDAHILKGEINQWLLEGPQKYDNPGREAFIEMRRRMEPACPPDCKPELGSCVAVNGRTSELSLHIPFGEAGVVRSGFWYTPALLSEMAFCSLYARKGTNASFTLSTCGRAEMWIDGKRMPGLAPYTRNREASVTFEAEMTSGYHAIALYVEDIAERDTDFRFCVECTADSEIHQCLPVKENGGTLALVEAFLKGLRFDRMSYTEGNISLVCDDPGLRRQIPEIKMTISGATEENHTAGLVWTKEALVSDASRITLGDCGDFPIGYMDCTVTAERDGIALLRKLAFENYPLKLKKYDAIGKRKRQVLETIAQYGEENINRAVALIETGGDLEYAERLLRRQIDDINARKDCSDFHLVYFPYLWKKYRNAGMFSEAFWASVRQMILHFRYWMDEPGNDVMWFFSENHALMFHTCQLLCGELFPDAYFPSPDMNGMGMQQKAKYLLKSWFERFFQEGCSEWNSSAYFPINSLGLGSLYLQAEDTWIRSQAKKALDQLATYLSQYSFKGYLASSAGRTYEKELFGNYVNGTTSMSYVLFGAGNANQAGKGVVSLCLSDYAPPEEAARFARIPDAKAGIAQMTQGANKYVSLYSYKESGYMLSSALCFRPGKAGYQEHPLHLVFTPKAQIFISRPGELAPFGSGRPSYWAGNAVLPLVWQYKRAAVIIYGEEGASGVPFSHIYVPREELDEVRFERNRLCIRSGNAYAMIACSEQISETRYGPYANREWICNQPCSVWMIRCGSLREFGSYEAFVRAMQQTELSLDSRLLRSDWDDPTLGHISASWDKPMQIDGSSIMDIKQKEPFVWETI